MYRVTALLILIAVGVLAAPVEVSSQSWRECVGIYTDNNSSDCTIDDTTPGTVEIYVVFGGSRAFGASEVWFSAPKPECFNATYLSESSRHFVSGNSQTGAAVTFNGYGASNCFTGARVMTIYFEVQGLTGPDCPYPVLPHPTLPFVAVYDCGARDLIEKGGGIAYVNSSLPCLCEAPTLAPILGVNKLALDFSGSDTVRTFRIDNAGGGTLSWTITESAPWLTLSAYTGTNKGVITATVDRTGLPNGSYSAEIMVDSNGGGATVTATMDVGTSTPTLGVSPMSLTFDFDDNSRTLTISNLGSGTLNWSIVPDVSWMSVAPNTGLGDQVVSVSADRTGLADGSYHGNLDITSNGGNLTVPVTLIVATEPVLTLFPTSLLFGFDENSKDLTISNGGPDVLVWSILSNVPWLAVTPNSGSGNQVALVTVDRTGLADGSYNGNLDVTSNGGNVTVSVTLIVSAEPVLIVNPNQLAFSASVTSRTFNIENGGTPGLTWTVTPSESWIDVNPSSGAGSGLVTVQVDPASLPPGLLSGQITVTSNGGTEVVQVDYTPLPAFGGHIGVYADTRGTNCNLIDTPGLKTFHVVHINVATATACQFATPMPSCMTGATWLSDTAVFPVTVGNSQDGVSVGYGECLFGPIHVLSTNYFMPGTIHTCCEFPVVQHPDRTLVEAVDCTSNLVAAIGATSQVATGACGCGTVAVHETTWGRVKAMYKE